MSSSDRPSGVRRLGPSWSAVLASQPETGMGYQVASVILKDGRVFDNVTIVGGTIASAAGSEQLQFVEEDIAEIIITHGKPGPYRQRI